MAEIRMLTPEQIAERERKPSGGGRSGRKRSEQRQQIIDAYKEALEPAEPGFGGDVILDENEDKRVVRQNLKAAADELGKTLEFRPIKDKAKIHFRVITPEEKAAKPKRGGRPKKVQPEAALETPEAQSPQSAERPSRRRRTAQPETA